MFSICQRINTINCNTSIIALCKKQQILDSSKLKEFAGDISKYYENGLKFSNGVENILGKGEIAC